MNRVFLMPALAGIVALPLLVLGLKRPAESAESAPAPPALTVTVVKALPLPSTSGPVLSGRVKSGEEVTLTAQTPARLTDLPIREGQLFRSGQTLATFDSPETRQSVESANAAVGAASANLNQARRQAARMDSLFKTGLVADRQRELAQTDREAAEAAWKGAQAALSEWRQNTRISVPFAGVVVRRYVDAGALLSPGQPILDVRSNAVAEIEVPVPESETAALSTGRALVKSGSSDWVPAEVLRVDGMIDYRTRTRMAHLRPTDLAGFEPGAYARVRLEGAGSEAPGSFSIPLTSVVHRGSLNGVFVVQDGRAWLRWLRTGRIEEDRVEVLAGLNPGDEIALGPSVLVDGSHVRVAR
jgi:multidrug efflux system membrane fusion protein